MIDPEEFITFRMYQNFTDRDFFYYNIVEDYESECLTLIDNNYGDFTTGYQQFLFQAKFLTYNCSDELALYQKSDPALMSIDSLPLLVKIAECPALEEPCP
jgi:hypothetical protein